MKRLIVSLLPLSYHAHAELNSTSPFEISVSGIEASVLQAAIGSSVLNLDCAEGFDWMRGQINCSAFSEDGAILSVSPSVAPILAEAKRLVFQASHLDPRLNVIQIQSVTCPSDEACSMSFRSGGVLSNF